ncbi:MAG: outer membrane beta-barrel protein [Desulfotignum sp.]
MKHCTIRTMLSTAALTLLCLAFSFTNAAAQGRFQVKPHIDVDWQSDSNFNYSESNEKSVYTYSVKPGIDLAYGTDKSEVSFDYYFQVFRYDDQDENIPGQVDADEYDYTAHHARFQAFTQFSPRLRLGLENTFWSTRDQANSDENTNSVERYKYNLNRLSPGLVYEFGKKFGLGLKYTNLYTDYSDDGPGEGEDSTEHRATMTWFYNLNTRTTFDLDFQYWNRDYKKDTSDYDSSQVMLNYTRHFNHLKLKAGVGYHNREFVKDVPSGDIDKVVWKLSGIWTMPKTTMELSVGSNLNDSGTGDNYYDSTRVDAILTHRFTQKIRGHLSGFYQNADYETYDRDDDRWQASLGGDYRILPNFLVGISGGLEERDSNVSGRNYDNEFIMINARFDYDLGSR